MDFRVFSELKMKLQQEIIALSANCSLIRSYVLQGIAKIFEKYMEVVHVLPLICGLEKWLEVD